MFPVIVPIVQLKALDILDVSVILGPLPLQILTVGKFVTKGAGFTVTVMENEGPVQPANEIGVTIYCTVPDVVLLGLVST